MAESTGVTPRGCLGRIFSLIGFAWIGFVFLVGIAAIVDEGFDPELIGRLGAITVPAIALIAGGRVIARRARSRALEEADSSSTGPVPDRPRETQPPRPLPRRPTPPIEPKPTMEEEVAHELLEGLERLKSDKEGGPGPAVKPMPPKTSQEMIKEARKRWSSDH